MTANRSTDGDSAVFRAYSGLSRFNQWLEQVLAMAAGACLALFTVVVAIDVVYRQVLSQPMMWPSEWSVMAFVWSVLLGAAVAASRNAHFVVVLVADRGRAIDHVIRTFVAICSVIFSIVLLYFGYRMMLTGARRFTPMMGYPMTYVFAAFPVAGVAFLLFTVEQLVGSVMRYPLRHGHESTDEVGSAAS
jgi:TRAP-type C4-dicarboxylate transport system permease small subunit